MDPRIIFTLACIAMLIAWFWLDILIDQIEMRRGPRGSWLGGIVLMILLAGAPNATVFGWATAALGAGLLLNSAYYLHIRRH
jgi:uncharacterized protein involved in cysteine biosynthesis